MSDHLKPQSPELIAALQNHGLKTDTPSQLSDAFRLGWKAAIIATHAPSDKIADAARKALRDELAYIDKGHHGMARNILAAALAGQVETP